jgi:hypothetical protein
MRRLLALLAIPVLALALVACSDDEPEADETNPSDTAGEDANIDTEALTEQFEDAILGEGSDSKWHVEAVTGDQVVIAPDEGETVTEDEANTVCGAVTEVAFSVLPTAVITVTDGEGQPLITSEGATGCHPVGEDE